jgi:hypothetical protein
MLCVVARCEQHVASVWTPCAPRTDRDFRTASLQPACGMQRSSSKTRHTTQIHTAQRRSRRLQHLSAARTRSNGISTEWFRFQMSSCPDPSPVAKTAATQCRVRCVCAVPCRAGLPALPHLTSRWLRELCETIRTAPRLRALARLVGYPRVLCSCSRRRAS